MPRVKSTKKSARKATESINGVGKSLKIGEEDSVVSSTTNGSSDLVVADVVSPASSGKALVPTVIKKGRGRQKKAIDVVAEGLVAKSLAPAVTGGRGRKKATPVLAETVVNGDDPEVEAPSLEIEIPKPKGRAKKSASKTEVKAVDEETPETPKAKGRGKKATAAVAAEVEIKKEDTSLEAEKVPVIKKPAKASKSSVRGRKKLETGVEQDDVVADQDALPAEIKEEKTVHRKKGYNTNKSSAEPQDLNGKEGKLIEPSSISKKKQKIEKIVKPGDEKPKKDAEKATSSRAKKQALEENVEIESSPKPSVRGKKRLLNPPAIIYAAMEDDKIEGTKSGAEIFEVKKKRVAGKAAKARATADMPAEDLEQITNIEEKKPVAQRGRKRTAAVNYAEAEADDTTDGAKPSKSKKTSTPINATDTTFNKSDFDLPPLENDKNASDNALDKRFNLKITSWNVAGLRSWLKKDGLKILNYEEPDIFCLQEIKCTTDQMPEEAARIPGYHPYWLCMPGGYAGVAIYSKIMPINVEYGIGNKDFDDVGRLITAEYEKFFLICVYVPNSGRKLVNLESRMRWENLFQAYVQQLDARKPCVICGDMNVSHQEIDLANPKTNIRNAGFTKEERDKMSELLALGFVDTFRHLYPTRTGAYTFWTYMGNARARNVGWRLDYFLVSQRLTKRVVENAIRSQCKGSDHCPITLFLKL